MDFSQKLLKKTRKVFGKKKWSDEQCRETIDNVYNMECYLTELSNKYKQKLNAK